MKKEQTLKILIAFALIAATWFVSAKIHAQTSGPQFLITWQANSLAPTGYKGKALPTAGSRVTASFELIDNGKIADLTGQTIYWYVNDLLISNVPGKQTASFLAPSNLPDILRLRIELPFYRNNLLLRVAQIPVITPEAIIESPYPDGAFSGTSVNLKGTPYFFNVSDPLLLNFAWSVNGQAAQSQENPGELVATINPDAQSGSTLNIGLSINNPKSEGGSASGNINLTYVK